MNDERQALEAALIAAEVRADRAEQQLAKRSRPLPPPLPPAIPPRPFRVDPPAIRTEQPRGVASDAQHLTAGGPCVAGNSDAAGCG
jgi:hypothetical protein